MSYSVGYTVSTEKSKCIICGKVTRRYACISQYQKDEDRKLNTSIEIPVCDKHYDLVASQKEILIGHAKTINTHLRKLKKED